MKTGLGLGGKLNEEEFFSCLENGEKIDDRYSPLPLLRLPFETGVKIKILDFGIPHRHVKGLEAPRIEPHHQK